MDTSGRDAAVAEGLAGLLRLPLDTTEPDLLRSAIDLAERLTGSSIGYLHYVNDDQETLELGTWSSGTFDYCTATSDRHYPISQAGVWADSFRSRRPRVINDYAQADVRRGLPPGHSPLHRHLGVAALDGDQVRLLLGVGNKTEPYDEQDVRIAQQVVDDTWLIMRRLREHGRRDATLELVTRGSPAARVGTWEWDPGSRVVGWGAAARSILGLGPQAPSTWEPLLDLLTPASARQLRERIETADPASSFDLQLTLAGGDGEPRTVRLVGAWVPRPSRAGSMLRGVVADTSLATRLAAAHFAALHDPLTGLLNRSGLDVELGRQIQSGRVPGSAGVLAVHFVDLDGFKTVNDRHGHFVGDEVLRVCASQLRRSVSVDDVVARFGGDEFVIVQPGAAGACEVRLLGEQVISAISTPITLGALVVRVGASIGAVVHTEGAVSREQLFARADAALYQAKSRGGGVIVLADPSDGGCDEPGR
jgi:diguanylate cyclase (GGDEF)-like protein